MSMAAAQAMEADALASEIITPRIRQKIRESIRALENGHDKELVLSVLAAFAYMEGMLAMSKVGLTQ